ncbi:3-isopropylmalate dehydratase [Candidatus Poribacteria bacterium]|nr:3-isopropylmalate dehydratase [Candidatus Poribacteria bacterium]
MEKRIAGRAFVLGDDVDTDQIIPAEHLAYNPSDPEERKMFGKFSLSGVPKAQSGLPRGGVPFVEEDQFRSNYRIIIAGKNFGCGSSREHAPLSLAEAGIGAVIAEFYARIFYRNSINGGYLIPFESERRMTNEIQTGDELELDVEHARLFNRTTGKRYDLRPLGDVLPIIEAGDVFAYAKASGMLAS